MQNPLWGKFIPSQDVKNYLSDTIEIGYSQYGMTLGVAGTMTATGKFTIIMNMSIDLFNKKDRYMFVFDWLAFRPIQFSDTGFQGIDLKMASKFLVTDKDPYKYNIVFADQAHYGTISTVMKQTRASWETALQTGIKAGAKNSVELFQSFIQRPDILQARQYLAERCYWTAETYTFKLVMSGKNNAKIHEDIKTFTLTSDDVKKLAGNPAAIIADICKQPAVNYSYLKVPLQNA